MKPSVVLTAGWLLAVAALSLCAPAKATVQVAAAPERGAAEVIGEGRSIPLDAGRFVDDFAPYAVHLYRIR